MAYISLPERVNVRLASFPSDPYHCADILVRVKTFARHKNDFHLGPFATNAEGVCTFNKQDLQAEARAHYDTGLMDYQSIEDCYPLVELSLYTADEISLCIKARTEIWTELLDGEKMRWKSMEELLSLYRRALSATRSIAEGKQVIRAEWEEPTASYEYSFQVLSRGGSVFGNKRRWWQFW